MGYAIKVQALDWESQFSYLTDILPFVHLFNLTQSNCFFPLYNNFNTLKKKGESMAEWNDSCLVLL